MAKRSKTRLTPGELEIMSVLWSQGSLTISEAHEGLGRPIGYTTVQTRLNRLVEKKLVRKSAERPARYTAAISGEDVGANHLEDLLARVAGGSIVPLVAHLVSDQSVTRQQLSELKELIRSAEDRLGESGGEA